MNPKTKTPQKDPDEDKKHREQLQRQIKAGLSYRSYAVDNCTYSG